VGLAKKVIPTTFTRKMWCPTVEDGRQICRRQNAGKGWPGGRWPTAEREQTARQKQRRRWTNGERARGRETVVKRRFPASVRKLQRERERS
jgi:hypothetical protein